MLVIVVVFVSLLVTFAIGFVVGSIMLQRSLARYLMGAVAKYRMGAHNREPRAMVEVPGVEALAVALAKDFLRSKN